MSPKLLARLYGNNDPAYGIPYNSLSTTNRVSREWWKVDIARTPRVVKDLDEFVNTQEKVYYLNSDRLLIDKYYKKMHGRGII